MFVTSYPSVRISLGSGYSAGSLYCGSLHCGGDGGGQVYKAVFRKRRAVRKGKAAPSGPDHGADTDADADPAAGPDADGGKEPAGPVNLSLSSRLLWRLPLRVVDCITPLACLCCSFK